MLDKKVIGNELFVSKIQRTKELVEGTELNSWIKIYDEAIRIAKNSRKNIYLED